MHPRRLLLSRILGLALLALGAVALPAAAIAPSQPASERKIALVIGNGDYSFSPLKNPVNDGQAMADALRGLGFEVQFVQNGRLRPMLDAIRSFVLKSGNYDVRLFYYAGHGVQLNGRNYLIPVDAEIQSEEDVAAKSVDVNGVLERLGNATSGINVVILDACRNNPFANGATLAPDGRRLKFRGPTPSGLAPMEAPTGTLVAFSTAPGQVAIDGVGASHSLYTKHLLANIATPGLPVEQLFKRVRIAVTAETRRQQIPWEQSSLMGDFCFKTAAGGTCAYDGSLFTGAMPK